MPVEKSGSGSVEPEDFNALVDAVNANGGSQPQLIVLRMTITPATPDLQTGFTVTSAAYPDGYELQVGDLVSFATSIPTAWDGDSPHLYGYIDGDDPESDFIQQDDGLAGSDNQKASTAELDNWPLGSYMDIVTSPGLLKAIVTDLGAPPTTGTATIIVLIFPA